MSPRRSLLSLSVASLVALAARGASAAPAASDRPGELHLRTEKVVVFKDGHALFVKSAQGVADARGAVFTRAVPEAAVLGTFWAFSEKAELRSVRAERVGVAREGSVPCASFAELLRANPGKAVTIGLREGSQAEVSGVVVRTLGRARPDLPEFAAGELDSTASAMARAAASAVPELVVLEAADGARLVLPIQAIRSVNGKGLALEGPREASPEATEKRLTFDLGAAQAGKQVALRILYFTPGLRWIPTYRVETGAGATAQLSLQGEILNEAEDVEGAEVSLVAGVPSFRFQDATSPLSLESVMRGALAQAAPSLLNQRVALSNATFQTRAGERVAPAAEGPQELAAGAREGRSQDLYVYPVQELTLRKGARAAVPLRRAQVPQRHTYALDLVSGPAPEREEPAEGGPLRTSQNGVWHELELSNNAQFPWTTGAALLMAGDLPLGQNLLAYTAPGDKARIPITIALDVQGRQVETELERTHDALKVDGRQLTRVRVRGTVQLTSHLRTDAPARVTLRAAGQVTAASDDARTEKTTAIAPRNPEERANPSSVVTWEVSVPAGGTRSLTYEVIRYQ